jgi:hypothetical protein
MMIHIQTGKSESHTLLAGNQRLMHADKSCYVIAGVPFVINPVLLILLYLAKSLHLPRLINRAQDDKHLYID